MEKALDKSTGILDGLRAYTGATEPIREVRTKYRVRYYRGGVSNFDQSEAIKHCFLVSDWLKFETLPR